jgi:hypothetical protein
MVLIRFRILNRNQNPTCSKVGARTAMNRYGSTTLLRRNKLILLTDYFSLLLKTNRAVHKWSSKEGYLIYPKVL